MVSSVNGATRAYKSAMHSDNFMKRRNVAQRGLGSDRAIQLQANRLSESRTVLYRKGQEIDNGYYIVEVSTLPDQSLSIAAFDV